MPTASPYGAAYAVAQTQLGLAKETTRGTPLAPTWWLPVRAPKWAPKRTFIADNTLQGSMVTTYSETPGMRYDAHGWEGYCYFDTFPALVGGQLGSPDTVTAAPTSTTLTSSAVAGATTILTAASIASGSFITLGSASAGTVESHKTTAVSGSGPYTVTLATTLVYNQASSTAVTGLTKHVFSLLNNAGVGNQPPSFTISDYDGEEWRQLAASQQDELNIKGNATALVDYTTTWFCNPFVTPSTPTPSFTAVRPDPAWTTSILLGGTQDFQIMNWEVDMKRGVKPIPAMTGTEEYFQYFAGPIAPTGKLTVVETSGAPELVDYVNGNNLTFDLFTYDVVTGYIMEIHCQNTLFTEGSLNRGNNEWVEADLAMSFLPSTNDATAGGVSPLQISFGNATVSAYQ